MSLSRLSLPLTQLAAVLLGGAVVGACDDSGATTSGGGSSSTSTLSTGSMLASTSTASSMAASISMEVTASISPSRVDNHLPASGKEFSFLFISVSNVGFSGSVAPAPAQFSLATDGNMTIATSALTLMAPLHCDGTVGLNAGASVSCALVFEIPSGTKPTALHFAAPDGTSIEASAVPAKPVPCVPTNLAGSGSAACTACADAIGCPVAPLPPDSCGVAEWTMCATCECEQGCYSNDPDVLIGETCLSLFCEAECK